MIYQNKENGFSTIIIILLVIIGIGLVTSLNYYMKNKASLIENLQEETQFPEEIQERIEERMGFQLDELVAGRPEDLVMGGKIVVRGSANQDGSITAETIYIGMPEEDFQRGPGFYSNDIMPEKGPSGTNRYSLPEGINLEELRNLSPEERMQRMQELRGEGGFPENRSVQRQSDSGFVRGEIIDKDEISIIVKLINGGSKIVFYSDNTEILLAQ